MPPNSGHELVLRRVVTKLAVLVVEGAALDPARRGDVASRCPRRLERRRRLLGYSHRIARTR